MSPFSTITTALSQVSQWSTAHPILTTILGITIATYIFLYALLHFTQDPKEPPLVLYTIPFLSPVIGMVHWSMEFYTHMRDQHPHLPIYTLRLPGTRIYIVNSTALTPIVQRQWKTLLFPPVTAQAMEGAFGGSKEGVALARQDMVTENGFLPGFIKALHPVLSPGASLSELNRKTAEVLTGMMDLLVESSGGNGRAVKMYEWIRHELLMATTDAVFGGHNPMRDSRNEDAWNTFHPSIMFLLLNILPLRVFRTPIRAREYLANSFQEYYNQDLHNKGGSAYIRAWTSYFAKSGIPESDIGHLQISSLFGLVANTVPAAFWMVYRVFSDEVVTRSCLEEVSKGVSEQVEKDGTRVSVIDAHYIKNECPVLVSVFQEVFRVHGMANSVRVAAEDHVLEGNDGRKYLIKKGGMIMMPGRVQHLMKEVWGGDVEVFDYRRFVKGLKRRHNPVAFRGFGGGTTLCPGRHFATTEILVFTAMLLLRFELVPLSDGGRWVLPTTANSSQAEAVEQPDRDIKIELRPRKEAMGRKWRVSFEGDVQAKLVAEDLETKGR